jgi:hypothetical protein
LSLRIAFAVLLLSSAAQASAASGSVTGYVTRVLITGDPTFGGCMAALSVNPQSVLGGCGAWWVSFSCTGDYTDRVSAYRMADQAQLALADSKQVQVFFRDTQKHNGYCFASRIDVLR